MINKKFILGLFIMVLLVTPMVSALDWTGLDNYGRERSCENLINDGVSKGLIDKCVDKYGAIEIWDRGLFLIGEDTQLTQSVLNFNTDQCLTDCEARPTITLYEEGALIEDIRYLDKDGKEVELEDSFTYKAEQEYIYQEIDVDNSKEVCSLNINGVKSCSGEPVYKSVTKVRIIDKEYNIGDVVPAGTYDVVIKAKKIKDQEVDWQIKVKGKWHTSWAWWNNNWDKKKQLNINFTLLEENSTSTLINVTFDSDMQNDFDDLRFLDSSETTEVGFWFYNNSFIDSNSVQVWLDTGNLSATQNKTFYMYYDNAVATTTSNIDNAFLFADDFNGTLIDFTTRWASNSEESYSVSGGILNATTVAIGNVITSINGFNDFMGEARVSTTVINNDGFYWDFSTTTKTYTGTEHVQTFNSQFRSVIDSVASDGGVPTISEYFRWNIEYPLTGTITTNTSTDDRTQILTQTATPATNRVRYPVFWRFNSGSGNVDWIFLRRHVEEEPTYQFGAEEQNVGVTATQSFPIDGFNTTDNTVDIGCNFSTSGGVGISNVTLNVYDSGDNLDYSETQLLADPVSFNNTFTTSALDDGVYNHACIVVGNSSEIDSSANRTLNIDTTNPNITIEVPVNGSTFVDEVALDSTKIELNWTTTDTNLAECWYYNQTVNVTVTCGANATFQLAYGTYTHVVYANDSFGNENSDASTATYTFTIQENNQSFNNNTFETSAETFSINVTFDTSVFISSSALLNYNGTPYVATQSGQIFSRTIDIPSVETDETIHEFFWVINLFNGTDSEQFNSTTANQSVNNTFLNLCNATLTTKSLNFTARDETEDTRISPYVFESTIEFWLGGGSKTNNVSIKNLTAHEINLCIFPNDDMKIEGLIAYVDVENSTTYNLRNFFFQEETISGTLQHIPLYLLKSSLSTSFILKVQDIFLLPLPDYLIVIEKFFPGDGVFKVVQIARTDENGKSVGFFQTETIDYRFIVKNNGTTHLTTGIQKVVGEEIPFTLTFTLGDNSGGAWQEWEDQSDLTHTLGPYNDSSNTIQFSYEDTSGDFTLGFLEVTRINQTALSDAVICDLDSTQSSAVITCPTGNESGTYSARGLIQRGSDVFLIDQVTFQIFSGEINETAGLYGVFLGWFLILVSAFAFKFNEIAGIWLMNAAVIAVNIFKLIVFSPLYITAMIAGSLIITGVIMKRRVQ